MPADPKVQADVLRVLRAHADEHGEVTAPWTQLVEWVGGDVDTTDVHEALIALKDEGRFKSHYMEGGGRDGAFSVTLHR